MAGFPDFFFLFKAKKLIRSTSGNVALTAAVLAPAVFGAAALGVDYTIIHNQKSALQQAADAAALASVRELSLSGSSDTVIQEVGAAFAHSAFPPSGKISNGEDGLSVEVVPSKLNQSVKVNLSYTWRPFLAHVFDYEANPIKVTATAGLAGDALTCIIGLMPPQPGWFAPKSSIHLDNNSVVQADGCAVFSNSESRHGLRADANVRMTASTICSAGGIYQTGGRGGKKFSPDPLTDCPKIDDPLAGRIKPSVGSCDHKDLAVSDDTTLFPGVYCGGITVSDDAEVVLRTGIYVIKDGPLIVTDEASMTANGVTFFLTGRNSEFEFHPDTSIDLTAAAKGSTAGLLFFEDRDVVHSFDFNPFDLRNIPDDVRLHRISSNDARNLLGTIYLPRSILLVDAKAPVADSSAYTAIITGRLWLREGPTLTLNADLTDTKVPVPAGLVATQPTLKR